MEKLRYLILSFISPFSGILDSFAGIYIFENITTKTIIDKAAY